MFPSCTHTHCRFDDGRGEPADYLLRAAELGYVSLGFSCHAPLPYANDWALGHNGLEGYLQAVRDLRAARGIEEPQVFMGLEIDYIPACQSPADARWLDLGLDYRLGAVHCLGRSADGLFRGIDGPVSEMNETLSIDFGGDARAMVESYFRRYAEMIEEGGFDVACHIDLIKKNNGRDEYFSEDAPWYRRAAAELVPLLRGADLIVEVNTGGLSRGRTHEVYPGAWLLGVLVEAGVRFTINSDAHRPEHLSAFYDQAERALLAAGCREVYLLRHGGWTAWPL